MNELKPGDTIRVGKISGVVAIVIRSTVWFHTATGAYTCAPLDKVVAG